MHALIHEQRFFASVNQSVIHPLKKFINPITIIMKVHPHKRARKPFKLNSTVCEIVQS